MMIVGILGLGQVGNSIKELCQSKYTVVSRDLNLDEFRTSPPIDILHVCIPYSNEFDRIVVNTIAETHPALVIIDATVAPGTTQRIHEVSKTAIAHCPTLGKHPDLTKYQKIFKKPVGAIDEATYKKVAEHFAQLGVKTIQFDSPLEAELAKILDTTYYAWNIFFEKWVYEICRTTRANFDQVYIKFNTIYNDGYATTLANVRRPVLEHRPGPIGGHCVVPNLEILRQWMSKTHPQLTSWIDFIVQEGSRISRMPGRQRAAEK